jgi:hypothetical protein
MTTVPGRGCDQNVAVSVMDLPPGSGLRGEGGQSPRQVRGVDDLEAGQLAEALGELPVALEQATALLAKTGMAADEYLRLLRDRAGAPGTASPARHSLHPRRARERRRRSGSRRAGPSPLL